MLSMTGFGREEYRSEGLTIQVEVKAVNHRYLDITFQMPSFLFPIENQLKQIVQQHVKRGKVSVSLHISGASVSPQIVETNWDLAKQYMEQLEKLQSTYRLTGDITIELLAGFPDVFQLQEQEADYSSVESKVVHVLESAVNQLHDMRQKEGDVLAKDIQERVKKMEEKIKLLGERRKIVIIEYQERIMSRIKQYLEHTPVYDETRMLTEVALLAEKGDVTEEITRIGSHLDQFQEIVKERKPIGRKLDFIVQELNRELNTIGSKSNDPWISEQIVYLKSETEKIKEQIQNIE
ncbi:uncharacterized protein (TIGR00255 family) [Gracilibacillus alcaliphilus]|nr:uncharacterized protein (TIGR00255 family) [Gracilibacillus alcaliphilus]